MEIISWVSQADYYWVDSWILNIIVLLQTVIIVISHWVNCFKNQLNLNTLTDKKFILIKMITQIIMISPTIIMIIAIITNKIMTISSKITSSKIIFPTPNFPILTLVLILIISTILITLTILIPKLITSLTLNWLIKNGTF